MTTGKRRQLIAAAETAFQRGFAWIVRLSFAALRYFGFFKEVRRSPIDVRLDESGSTRIKDRRRSDFFKAIEDMDLYELRALQGSGQARARHISKIRLSEEEFSDWLGEHMMFKERERDSLQIEETRFFRRRVVGAVCFGLVAYLMWPDGRSSRRRSRFESRFKGRF